MLKPHLPVLALSLALLALSPPARAQTSPQDAALAETLYQQGVADLHAEKFREGKAKLEASLALDPGIGTLANLAWVEEKLGATASSWSHYLDAVALATKKHDERAKKFEPEVKRLEALLSKVQLHVAPENRGGFLVIQRDGTVIPAGAYDTPIPLDPGEHTITAESSKPGKKPWKVTVTIPPKPGVTTVEVPALEDAPAAPEASKPGEAPPFWTGQRIAGVTVSAAGAVGLAIGAAFGARALGQNSDSKAQCQPQNPSLCNASGIALYQDAVTSAHVSTASLVIGGAAAVAGVVVVLAAPGAKTPEKAARVEAGPMVGGGTRGLLVRAIW